MFRTENRLAKASLVITLSFVFVTPSAWADSVSTSTLASALEPGASEYCPSGLPFTCIPLNQQVTQDKEENPNVIGSCRWTQNPNGDQTVQQLNFSSAGNITVDFGKPGGTTPTMNGFFYNQGDIQNKSVSQAFAQKLSPQLWSTGIGLDNIDFVLNYNATPHIGLEGAWNSKTDLPPYVDPTTWQANIATFVEGQLDKGVYWTVWDEPDCQYQWSKKQFKLGTGAQRKANTFQNLFDTYKSAYATIRGLKGGKREMMAGHAWNAYDRNVIGTFLEYALANGLEVNALVWHELGQSANNRPLVQAHIQDAMNTFITNSRYSPLNIKSILIDESLQPEQFNKKGDLVTVVGATCAQSKKDQKADSSDCFYPPGELLAVKYFSEQAANPEVTSLQISRGTFEQVSNTLGFRLDPNFNIPLGAYWAEYLYANLGQNRVDCGSDNQQVVCFASPASENSMAQILVAYYGPLGYPNLTPITMNLKLKHPLSSNDNQSGYLQVQTVSQISTTPIPALITNYVPLSLAHGDTFSATLPALSMDQAFLVTPMVGIAPTPLSFGDICPRGRTCVYTGAVENTPVAIRCAEGILSSVSGSYYSDTILNFESCTKYLSKTCKFGNNCEVNFNNNTCDGDPNPQFSTIAKFGTATVTCQ